MHFVINKNGVFGKLNQFPWFVYSRALLSSIFASPFSQICIPNQTPFHKWKRKPEDFRRLFGSFNELLLLFARMEWL